MNVERWEQTTGEAVAKRLVVASMACLAVWHLQRDPKPEAATLRRFLIRLSGRQMKYKVERPLRRSWPVWKNSWLWKNCYPTATWRRSSLSLDNSSHDSSEADNSQTPKSKTCGYTDASLPCHSRRTARRRCPGELARYNTPSLTNSGI